MDNNEKVKNTKEKTTKVKIKSKKWNRDDTELTLLALPTFVWYILFCFLPMFGVVIAFKRYQIFPGKSFLYNIIHSEWVGFANFEYLIKSNSLFILLRNTIGYNLVFIVLGIVIPVTLAIMISLIYSKRKSKVYQTAMFFPHFLSWVVVSYFVFAFLSYDKGILNSIVRAFGKEPVQWYMEAKYWPFILVFMNLWKTTGYSTVVYLASITGIDPSLYEAAVVDGATKWQQVKNITLPSLKPIVIMMFILSTGRIFYSDFGLFWQVTRGIPASLYNVSSTIDTYVYNALLSNTPIGMTSAATVFQSVACCITILIANWVVKKIDNDYAII
ncbi:MAG TPA: sugar ABC transporter permease [Lachnospiraceae bacterium]|jgi:putative aldouronate transport system permease protein|nr:sugar ABC transporter permease [Lachnospiraceae bacterium]HBY71692.1 sugar ABC transporter permease [Lachnospiraceae bacterium]HCA69999.1 sugar ABC transporter permease [Lachnospiraceae bacterium]HCM12236.1 sugar ABC transporter permease [Lachnospiraceae bacterium]HCR39448.1 sugar ABC transporter permease [Lachnospiraceae bacterium]